MSRPFKMKGSPLQRNFGIGSPVHDHEKDKDGNVIEHEVDPDAPGTPGEEGFEPSVVSSDYLLKEPSIVASQSAKDDYDSDNDDVNSKETERINKPPATIPPIISDADTIHRKVKEKINKGLR